MPLRLPIDFFFPKICSLGERLIQGRLSRSLGLELKVSWPRCVGTSLFALVMGRLLWARATPGLGGPSPTARAALVGRLWSPAQLGALDLRGVGGMSASRGPQKDNGDDELIHPQPGCPRTAEWTSAFRLCPVDSTLSFSIAF